MISVLHKAAGILEFLGSDPPRPRGLAEVAAAMGIKTPTCANILKTLLACGLADQTAPRQGYTLGPLIHQLAGRAPYRGDLVRLAEGPIRRLAAQVRETVLLAVVQGGKRHVLFEVDGDQDLQARPDRTGADVYRSATGRLLLAHLPPRDLEAIIALRGLPDAWPEAAGREQLLAQLGVLRKRRIVTIGRNQIVGLAAPLREGDRVSAALGLYLPALRFRGNHKKQVLDGLLSAAAAISGELCGGKTREPARRT